MSVGVSPTEHERKNPLIAIKYTLEKYTQKDSKRVRKTSYKELNIENI